jgi:hypothetical protein
MKRSKEVKKKMKYKLRKEPRRGKNEKIRGK